VQCVTNDTVRGDPNRGQKKNLKVLYNYSGQSYTKFVSKTGYGFREVAIYDASPRVASEIAFDLKAR